MCALVPHISQEEEHEEEFDLDSPKGASFAYGGHHHASQAVIIVEA